MSRNPRNHFFAFLFFFFNILCSLFCDCLKVIRFRQVFMTFSSFVGRKCCKTQETHEEIVENDAPLPHPRFLCGRSCKSTTRSCHHHPSTSYPDTPVKNNKNTRFVISFHFISFHFISFHCVLFNDSFMHSFNHSFIHSFVRSFIHFILSFFLSFHFFHFFHFFHSFILSFFHSFIHSFIQSYSSWVCLPGFSERWAAELRQGFPAKALRPAG